MTRTIAITPGLFIAGSHLVAEEVRKPNFVIIMVDDMGYAGVSCLGNPYFKTPEIDRLAAEGIKLTDFHSSGTVCSRSGPADQLGDAAAGTRGGHAHGAKDLVRGHSANGHQAARGLVIAYFIHPTRKPT